MTLGMFMYAFGWVACIIPAGGMGGGATGLSMLLNAVFPALSIGTFVFIINALLLIIAGFIIGWNFGIKTIYCVVVMSVVMHFLQVWFTTPEGWVAQIITARDALTVPHGTIVDLFNLQNRLLSAILGGICSGVGVAMCFQQGGSTGGSDIVVMIVNKFYTISYGKFIRLTDGVIISSALFLPDVGIDGVIYGLIVSFLFSTVIDKMMYGINAGKLTLIVTDHGKMICDLIDEITARGSTILEGQGGFQGAKKQVVMCACSNKEMYQIQTAIREADPASSPFPKKPPHLPRGPSRTDRKHPEDRQSRSPSPSDPPPPRGNPPRFWSAAGESAPVRR
mgnify:CR=1 FL=1